jgi:prepilin-type N-terminal cleavage/methylation domain-containing protein
MHRRSRKAFTLIELLVVITIVVTIAAAGYFFLPQMTGSYNRSRGIDQLQEWLLTAKQRAKRDLVPTGIRLLPNGTVGQAQGNFTSFVYVQQPDSLMGTATSPPTTCQTAAAPPNTLSFTFPAGVDNFNNEGLVQAGDYWQQTNPPGLPMHQVVSIDGTGTQVTLNTAAAPLTLPVPAIAAPGTSSYLFYRQPRPMSGEDVKLLPPNLVVLAPNYGSGSINIPSRTVGTTVYYEIVFSPTGAVIGSGTAGGRIILWMRDTSMVTNPGLDTLIAIQPRAGFIGSFDVSTTGDPYTYTTDGRASGL